MSFFDWLDELKCKHEYEYIGKEQGYNYFDEEVTREWFRCKKCLKEKYIDSLGW